jgi:hypothetical protein
MSLTGWQMSAVQGRGPGIFSMGFGAIIIIIALLSARTLKMTNKGPSLNPLRRRRKL